MMYTGMVLGRRFYVGADSVEDAIGRVRKAHQLLHGRAAADELVVTGVTRTNNVTWMPR